MMLMLLLTELIRLQVRLLTEADDVHIQAPAGVLTGELCQAMTEHKAALLRFARFLYVETIDGLGTLTGHIQEQDISWVAPQRQEALHYKIGVMSLSERTLRFYWPHMVLLARPEAVQVSEQWHEGAP
jgi:hypothetical protein